MQEKPYNASMTNISPFGLKVVIPLAALFAFRMLGLFMILPVFAVDGAGLSGATPSLIGLALGIYGLTQALFQMPLGSLSDRVGRKPIITGGLIFFALGSVIAALSHGIFGMILGRALQGAGAIGSTILALTADLTTPENRTKAMAIIGLTIGTSFTLAMVLGPVIHAIWQLSGIFWLTAALALAGIGILHTCVPTPPRTPSHGETQPIAKVITRMLRHPELMRLNIGICLQHAILTACFLALPTLLTQTAGLPIAQQWQFYLPIMVLAFLAMLPFIILAERKNQIKPLFIVAISVLALTQVALALNHNTLWFMAVVLTVFFTAFSLLEASLPSLVSKIAPAGSKGTATGIYSTAQFLGIFIGGALGGTVLTYFNLTGVFWFTLILAILWLPIAGTMERPASYVRHESN